MTDRHEILDDGESTEKWAFREKGFFGSIKQITHCARCGDTLKVKGYNEPVHSMHIFKPTFHFICDECYDQLPD